MADNYRVNLGDESIFGFPTPLYNFGQFHLPENCVKPLYPIQIFLFISIDVRCYDDDDLN